MSPPTIRAEDRNLPVPKRGPSPSLWDVAALAGCRAEELGEGACGQSARCHLEIRSWTFAPTPSSSCPALSSPSLAFHGPASPSLSVACVHTFHRQQLILM